MASRSIVGAFVCGALSASLILSGLFVMSGGHDDTRHHHQLHPRESGGRPLVALSEMARQDEHGRQAAGDVGSFNGDHHHPIHRPTEASQGTVADAPAPTRTRDAPSRNASPAPWLVISINTVAREADYLEPTLNSLADQLMPSRVTRASTTSASTSMVRDPTAMAGGQEETPGRDGDGGGRARRRRRQPFSATAEPPEPVPDPVVLGGVLVAVYNVDRQASAHTAFHAARRRFEAERNASASSTSSSSMVGSSSMVRFEFITLRGGAAGVGVDGVGFDGAEVEEVEVEEVEVEEEEERGASRGATPSETAAMSEEMMRQRRRLFLSASSSTHGSNHATHGSNHVIAADGAAERDDGSIVRAVETAESGVGASPPPKDPKDPKDRNERGARGAHGAHGATRIAARKIVRRQTIDVAAMLEDVSERFRGFALVAMVEVRHASGSDHGAVVFAVSPPPAPPPTPAPGARAHGSSAPLTPYAPQWFARCRCSSISLPLSRSSARIRSYPPMSAHILPYPLILRPAPCTAVARPYSTIQPFNHSTIQPFNRSPML